ncbi:PDR/VanB family oxidoreductase [Nocardia sp. NPDC050408]|uniref:PDR/VanB family oxidoreductase n=1 Tax=Nocardia sp. NPDC050408 TaxID=3364319 RepID=UPI0037B64238
MNGHTVIVSAIRDVGAGVREVTVSAKNGLELPHWSPGAHVDLHLSPGMTRQYSLTGEADARDWRIAVLREPASRGGSAYVHEQLQVGHVLETSEPRNHFEFDAEPDVILIAGGIGITPMVPMLRDADRLGLNWRLLYGGRSASSMAYSQELLARFGDRVILWPQDSHGLLPLEKLLDGIDARAGVYVCGPPPLIDAVYAACERGGSGATIHSERFTPVEVDADGDTAFDVELARSGLILSIEPGESVLERVNAAGVFAASSCGEGTCGACETAVIDGDVDHRDSVLSAPERAANDCMMICVSRSQGSRLVLDL